MKNEYIAAFIAFAITVILGAFLLPVLTRLKFGQTVRTDGPQRHFVKMGTPTMGGIMFIPTIAISSFIVSSTKSMDLLLAIFIMIGFGLIGFFDDYIKIRKKRSLGLRANQKLLFQLVLSILLAFYTAAKSDILYAPFFKSGIDLGFYLIPFQFLSHWER